MKWYQKTGWIIALLIIFFPAGLFLMWKYAGWGKVPKIFVTCIIGIIFIISVNTANKGAVTNTADASSQQSTSSGQARDSSIIESSSSNVTVKSATVQYFETLMGMDESQATSVYDAMESAGLGSFKSIEKTANWSNGERYIITYNGETYKLYLNKDKSVNSINDSFGNKIYSK